MKHLKIHDRWSHDSRVVAAIIVACLLLFNPGYVPAADDNFFLKQQIEVSGYILGCRPADFSGDGLIDLAVLVIERSGRRSIKSYLQRSSGRFPPSAGQTILISSTANVIETHDLDGDGKSELLVIDYEGLWQYRHDGENFNPNPKSLISRNTIFSGGIDGSLLAQPFIHSVSGSKIAFLPVVGGFSLARYRDGKFRDLGKIDFDHTLFRTDRPVKLFGSGGRRLSGSFVTTIPEIVIADANKDGLDDIYLIWNDRLAIYHQNQNGHFESEAKIAFSFQNIHDGDLCMSRLVDYDRDGRLDLVTSRTTGGISEARTDIDFYGSDRFANERRVQSHHISLTDACCNLMIDNFDRQGGLELVIPAIELGIMSTVKKLISKKTDFYLLIYPIDNLGRPSREPAVRKKLTCKLNFANSSPTADILIDWSGDYDGDGILDLVLADGGDHLKFYRGVADRYLQNKADLVLDMPTPEEIRPEHLNNDGRSDLIIIHRHNDNGSKITLLVTNRIG